QVRVFVRPYGSSVPLGFLAFAVGMFMYAALDAPWVKATDGKTIGIMLIAFVAPLQSVATVIAFLARDTVPAVALGLFTGPWLTTGVLTVLAKPGQLDAALGIFCIAIYTGLAFLFEDARGEPLLPIGRRGSSREAIEGGLEAQLKDIADEPGVRKHL